MQMRFLLFWALVTINLSRGQYAPPNLQYQAYVPPMFNYQALIPSAVPTSPTTTPPPTTTPAPATTTTAADTPTTTAAPTTTTTAAPATTTAAPTTTTVVLTTTTPVPMTTTQAVTTPTTSNAAYKVVESSIATPDAAATTTARRQEATTACTGGLLSTTAGCTGQSSTATMPPPTMASVPPVEPVGPVEEKTHAPIEQETTVVATLPPQHVIDTVVPPITQNYGSEPTHPEPSVDNGYVPSDYSVGPMHSEPVTDKGQVPPNYSVEPTHTEPTADKGYTPPNHGIFPDSFNAIGEEGSHAPHETPLAPHVPETPSATQELAPAPFTYEGEVGGPPGSEPQPPEVETPAPKGGSNYAFPTLLGGNYGSYANGGPAPKFVVDKPQKNQLTNGGSGGSYGFPPSPKSTAPAPTTAPTTTASTTTTPTTTTPTTTTTTTTSTTTTTTTAAPTTTTVTGVTGTPCPFSGGATTTTRVPVKPPCPSSLYGDSSSSMAENRGYDAKPLDAQGHRDKMGRRGEKRKPVMARSFDAKDVALAPSTDDSDKRPGGDPTCNDNFAMCYLWALDGECETNPFWMKPNCQLSCKSCGVALADVEKPSPKKHENCTNKHELCQFWKKAGECTRNEAYMRKYCPLSCDLC